MPRTAIQGDRLINIAVIHKEMRGRSAIAGAEISGIIFGRILRIARVMRDKICNCPSVKRRKVSFPAGIVSIDPYPIHAFR